LQNKLSQLFAQWEHDPPIISGMHAKGKLKDAFSIGQSLGLLIEEPSASSIDCPDCSRRWRRLLELRNRMTMAEIATLMNVPRTTLNEWMKRIRDRFEEEGFQKYLDY
jgi:hypothetical protein